MYISYFYIRKTELRGSKLIKFDTFKHELTSKNM